MSKIKPFLRWAGGKTWLTKHIEEFLPTEFNNYFEPFIGGGAIFLYLKSKNYIKNKSYLSDSNQDLINTYRIIKSNPDALIKSLQKFKNTEEYYYKIRGTLFDNKIENASKFIYLNKTSYNGIYRVNSKGEYNVPYGHRKTKDLFEFDNILKISELFEKTYFSVTDFKKKCYETKENDFIFLDPPYTVAHENNGFIQYNQSLFSWKNQIELAQILKVLEQKKTHFILTNASHKSIDELYQTGNKKILARASNIGGTGAKRTNYNEIIISNATK
ncbi:DNA adenine methylase [Flavobacterium sp. N502540]|uniref:DNA adenine methylase n=1 Tax=Flavobacterium sp. N502540 TaxID=2986838 RepID=UPI0022241BF7|nr:Dam family site-specific DNA-(adenine-N6)-methyltransferase [Flavobacterium sp. N502540]